MKQLALLLIIILSAPLLLNGQENYVGIKQKILERIAESFTEELSEESEIASILEDLEILAETSFNINNTTRKELENLQFLNSFQIENLLAYIQKYGQIFTVNELMAIDGFDDETVENISVFVTFLPRDDEPQAYLNHELNFRYQQNIEKQNGFVKDENNISKFSGIAPKLLVKYKAEQGTKLQFGFIAENDAGEDFFNNSNRKGFDFYSGYIGYRGKKILKEVYLGDFHFKAGQGLIQWSGYGARKSNDVTKIRTTGQGLRASTSADENNFLRGTAALFSFKNFNLTTYFSSHKVDANITEFDSLGHATMVSSLQATGYHRTENELTDEDALKTQQFGTNLNYTFNRLSMGFSSNFQFLDATLFPSLSNYNSYYFRGNDNYNLSTDFVWVQNKINLFGEAAISKSKGKAIILGMESQPCNEVAISLLYRDFAKDFNSISGSSFAESAGNRNERGFYSGITLLPFARSKFSVYLDTYESHWMKYTSTAPVKGTDLMVQTDYSPNRKLEMYLRFKIETNSEKESITAPIKPDIEQTTNRLRFNLAWKPTQLLRIQLRTEWAGYTKADSTENGLLLFTDATAKTKNDRFSGTLRIAWFSTNSYNTRIYAYENDVPLSFYIPAFYDQGWRLYANMKCQLSQRITTYFKYAITKYSGDVTTIGTGDSQISGNRKSEFKIHLKYRF